jgi:hypothetical protein
MPALENKSVGSSFGITGEEDTILCPFDSKKSIKDFLISFCVFILKNLIKI